MRRAPYVFLLLALCVAAPPGRRATAEGPRAPEAVSFPVSRPGERPHAYPQAAEAFRRGDFDAAWNALAPLLTGDAAIAGRARLVAGLYAYSDRRFDAAVDLLQRAQAPDLEDWRLFALADGLAEGGSLPAASAALDLLLAEQSGSPLRELATVRSVEWRREQGDLEGALAAAIAARASLSDRALQDHLDGLVWEIAETIGGQEARRQAARHLLVHQPLEASKRQVVDLLRSPGGALLWREHFTADQLSRRAGNLIAAGLHEAALKALDEVAQADRDDRWVLLRAEALTGAARGFEALELLRDRPVWDAPNRVDYLWRAAEAALDASVARSGRSNLSSEKRKALEVAALTDLTRIAALGDANEAARALGLRYSRLDLEGDFEATLTVLAELRELDPDDTTGAQDLWRLGWSEYSRRNYTGAIGTWLELGSLYPETRWARAGRYWSAAAHQALGRSDRATTLWEALTLADTEDFYSRHARGRLGVASRAPAIAPATTESWPDDPRLARARLLTDLGLDGLALIELEAVAPGADGAATEGVRALVLERLGNRRESIRSLWRVFRRLGSAYQASIPEDARRMYYPLDFYEVVRDHATARGLSPYTVMAIIRQESAFDATAISRSGARGLMQLMPATGQELAVKAGIQFSNERLYDPELSVRLGSTYFRQVLDMFGGNVELALAGYNGGPYRIKRWWSEAGGKVEIDAFIEGLPLDESRTYVQRILLFSDSYRQLYGDRG